MIFCNQKLVEVVQEDGTFMSVYKNYADENFNICDNCGKYHEEPLTQVEENHFVCNECLKEEYVFVDGNYVLKSEHAS